MVLDLIEGDEPQNTVAIGHNPPKRVARITTACTAGTLVVEDEITYTNGVDLAAAQQGDGGSPGIIEQVEIPALHPQSTTPYDKTTQFQPGDNAVVLRHVPGRTYWVPLAAATTASRGDLFYISGSGRASKVTWNGVGTEYNVHGYMLEKDITSKSWARLTYLGIIRIMI